MSGPTRTAIVTGGANGIGRASARLLTDRGVRVAVLDVNGPEPVDVSDEDSVNAAVGRIRASLGPIDIVVNCAGLPAVGRMDSDDYLASWRRSLEVNLHPVLRCPRAR